MPYVSQEQREQLAVLGTRPQTVGELNYVLTGVIRTWLSGDGHPLSYTRINEVMGVLACISQEVYRRVAVPYEERKMKENGDVFNVGGDR